MFRAPIIFIALAMLFSCSSETSSIDPLSSPDTNKNDPLVKSIQQEIIYAKIGKEEISQAYIDKILELRLFDLEWAKYDLRRQTLSEVINAKTKNGLTPAEKVNVLIEPPMPPRLAVEINDQQPSHGASNAPITLAIFCSYPSVHCANMTKTYDDLVNAYPNQIKLMYFDFPQAFHYNAGHAARAARCANEGGQFWPYHKGLLANFDQMSEALFLRMAQQVNLDTEQFKHCFESDKFTNDVKGNLQLAQTLGLSKVPVTLINGLFMNGPRSFDTLRFYIDTELARLNIASTYNQQQLTQPSDPSGIPISQLPLRLEAVTLGASLEDSRAIIQNLKDEASDSYKYDDEILPNTFLVMIDDHSVVLEHEGKLERIMLSSGHTQDPTNEEVSILNSGHNSEPAVAEDSNERQRGNSLADPDPDDIPSDLEYTFRGVVSPKGETPLSRTWLTEQLVQRDELKSHFEAAEHEVEGMHMMRLTNIQENDFYQTLGLHEKDVVLRVNNEWVHSGQNNLFDTLENQQEVSVVLMRKGLPLHLNFHIN